MRVDAGERSNERSVEPNFFRILPCLNLLTDCILDSGSKHDSFKVMNNVIGFLGLIRIINSASVFTGQNAA